MIPFPIAIWLVAALVQAAPRAAPGPKTPVRSAALESLIAAERGFSKMSVDHGMRDAFLANLGEDAVVFRPLPTSGRAVWEAQKPSPAILAWEPAFAAVSAAADLGYTTGPWELRPPKDIVGGTPHYGHFISVWGRPGRHQPWKVVLDVGVNHDKPALGVGSGALAGGPAPGAAATADVSVDALRAALGAEAAFSAEAARRGLRATLANWATPELRLNRDGHLPTLGWKSAASALAADTLPTTFQAQNGRASRSGDLAVTYGLRYRQGRAASRDSSVFVHVWRASRGQWRIALSVENPLD